MFQFLENHSYIMLVLFLSLLLFLCYLLDKISNVEYTHTIILDEPETDCYYCLGSGIVDEDIPCPCRIGYVTNKEMIDLDKRHIGFVIDHSVKPIKM